MNDRSNIIWYPRSVLHMYYAYVSLFAYNVLTNIPVIMRNAPQTPLDPSDSPRKTYAKPAVCEYT